MFFHYIHNAEENWSILEHTMYCTRLLKTPY